jgi:ABC-type amino acid transport substrate-binding protein
MKYLYKTAIALCGFYMVLSYSSLYAQETVNIAVHNYPPFYDLNAKGLMTEVYEAAFNRVGVNVSATTLPVKRGVTYLFNNKVDAFSPGHILIPDNSKAQVVWENSFIVVLVMTYYKPHLKKQLSFTSLAELKGYRIAILVNSPYIEEYKKHNLTVFPVQTPQQMMKMLKAGNVDMSVNALLAGLLEIKREFPDEWENFDYFVWDLLPCSLAVNKDNPMGLKRLDQFRNGFEQIKKDGTYVRILENYWGKNNIPKGALFKDLTSFGVDHVDFNTFYTPKRNSWGKIIE